MIFGFILQYLFSSDMLDYKTQHENRRSGTKELGKSLLFLLVGLFLSFIAYAIYMAFSRQPEAMNGILLIVGPFALLWAFERIWWHKRKRTELEARLFDWEQHKQDIIEAVSQRVSGGVKGSTQDPDIDKLLRLKGSSEEEILENLKYALPGYNYHAINRLLERYKDFPKVKMVLLNARRFWDRNPERDKYKSRDEIEGVNPSPRVIDFG